MKRSEVNRALREMEAMIRENGVHLPPFCDFTPEDWQSKGHAFDEVRDNLLGWDITDYGLGDFDRVGFSLITLRNGNLLQRDRYPKSYAEKLLYLKEGQYSPNHFHWNKMEDIINRGGGDIVFRLWNAAPDDGLDGSDVRVESDGRTWTVGAGSEIVLSPGQSLTLYPRCYHEFTVRPGTGYAIIGEVSMCNDDQTDNRFLEPLGRFPTIEEDEPPYRLLCTEYPTAR